MTERDKYCVYCLRPQMGRLVCCQEADFVGYAELPREDQAAVREGRCADESPGYWQTDDYREGLSLQQEGENE